jgi:exodeoxyribonuclease VII small subunit
MGAGEDRARVASDTPFEVAFAELEEVVRQLEEGDLTLENAIGLYERGQALVQFCQTLLDKAELRVEQLGSGAQPGEPVAGGGLLC